MWSIIEISPHMRMDDDLHLSLGGQYKMVLNYTDNLMDYPNVIDFMRMEDLTESIEIEFDPSEPQVFFFSTSEGLFKIDKT